MYRFAHVLDISLECSLSPYRTAEPQQYSSCSEKLCRTIPSRSIAVLTTTVVSSRLKGRRNAVAAYI